METKYSGKIGREDVEEARGLRGGLEQEEGWERAGSSEVRGHQVLLWRRALPSGLCEYRAQVRSGAGGVFLLSSVLFFFV
jgi:hypothetical protein